MALQHLEKHIERIPFAGCWLYNSKDGNTFGHARVTFNKRHVGAHRLFFELYRGEIPEGLHVLHRCDVPCCVNPEHLFLGTAADNMADKARKGRSPDRHGERHPLHRLTWEQIAAIRQRYAAGEKQLDLANQYGTRQDHISRIVNNKAWIAKAMKEG